MSLFFAQGTTVGYRLCDLLILSEQASFYCFPACRLRLHFNSNSHSHSGSDSNSDLATNGKMNSFARWWSKTFAAADNTLKATLGRFLLPFERRPIPAGESSRVDSSGAGCRWLELSGPVQLSSAQFSGSQVGRRAGRQTGSGCSGRTGTGTGTGAETGPASSSR